MLVYVQVAFGVNCEVHHAVLANLFEHMVEESQACRDVALARSIEV